MMPHLSPSTLGHLRDDDYRLGFYCEEILCGRALDLNLDKAIALWGADLEYVGHRWPVRCAGCGSKKIGVRITPGSYKEQRRRAAERDGR